MDQNVPHSKATEISNTNKARSFYTGSRRRICVFYYFQGCEHAEGNTEAPETARVRFLVQRDIPLKYPEEFSKFKPNIFF